ncbi:O-methyltransferase-domain-containing protein [Apiospora kogelbergensis]|uniref:O-methyltransferase-domain-containing protein n=1 Tax=Apiospora kogelbergensis TaxID=1337665 RepID=A0AAW0RBC1_9PEZI
MLVGNLQARPFDFLSCYPSAAVENESDLGLTKDIDIMKKAEPFIKASAPTNSTKSSAPWKKAEYWQFWGSLRDTLENLQHLVDGPACGFQVVLEMISFTLGQADDEIFPRDLAKQSGLGRIIRILERQNLQKRRGQWRTELMAVY